MRVKAIIFTFIFALFALTGQAQNGIFEKIEKTKDVQVVHVSKSLLSSLSTMGDFSALADKLKQIDVYSSSTKEAAASMKSQADFFGKSQAYEAFMSVKDEGEQVLFYGKKNGERFQELVMIVLADGESTIMRFQGDFTAKDIQEVIKNKK